MNPQHYKESLERLGYNVIDNYDHYRMKALYRSGGNAHSLVVYKDSGVWVDFGAANDPAPFEKLVALTLGTTDKERIKEYTPSREGFTTETATSPEDELTMEKTWPDTVKDLLLPKHDFYIRRGISKETLRMFHGGLWLSAGEMNRRYTFPIYNQSGQIHGLAGRTILSGDDRLKWKICGPKKNFLYPLYIKNGEKYPFREAVESLGEVHIVESVGDALTMVQNNIPNVAVSFGLSLSASLISYLSSFKNLKIFIGLNNDSEKKENNGVIAACKAYADLCEFFDEGSIKICMPSKNDFGEMSNKDFEEWRQKKIKIANGPSQTNHVSERIKEFVSKKQLPQRYKEFIK